MILRIDLGTFFIDSNIYGSNIIKSSCYKTLFDFLTTKDYFCSKTVVFSRLHHRTTTFHAYTYPRKGSTCSYLISYESDDGIEYGFILCFLVCNNKCQAMIQKIKRVNRSITSYFQTYKHLNAIKDFIDELYVVVERIEPSLCNFDHSEIISIDQIRFRSFSVPMETDFMILVDYACAFEHN